MILQAFGVPLSSPIQLSEILSKLQVSHSVVGISGNKIWQRDVDTGSVQPAWVIVLDSVLAIKRFRCNRGDKVIFVCDSPISLSTCNLVEVTMDNMYLAVKESLKVSVRNPIPGGWKIKQTETSIMEYVDSATKPSFLNFIQTAIYKISPYPLRKEVQNLTVSYLNGDVPFLTLKAKLQSSYKLTDLLELCKNPKADNLKKAVATFKKSAQLEATAIEYGIETFEILYVTNSAKRNHK